MGHAADRQLSVRAEGCRALDQGRGAFRHRDLARGLQLGMRSVRELGVSRDDLVPFEKYANAAQSLVRPWSAARALFAGAPNIERVDRLVQAIAAQKGNAVVDETVALVDARLATNRKAAA
jgi:hypothetical protein